MVAARPWGRPKEPKSFYILWALVCMGVTRGWVCVRVAIVLVLEGMCIAELSTQDGGSRERGPSE